MVLVTGGSRGAKTINQAMLGVHKYFKDKSGIYIHHVTGTLAYDEIVKSLGEVKDGRYGKGSHIIKYEYDMPSALAAADLIVCRAGAISLAELAAKELPSILIPYPYASEDHQTFNARVFVAAGASKMIIDKYMTDKELIQDISELCNNYETLENMSESTKKLKKINAGADIAHLALELAERGKK